MFTVQSLTFPNLAFQRTTHLDETMHDLKISRQKWDRCNRYYFISSFDAFLPANIYITLMDRNTTELQPEGDIATCQHIAS